MNFTKPKTFCKLIGVFLLNFLILTNASWLWPFLAFYQKKEEILSLIIDILFTARSGCYGVPRKQELRPQLGSPLFHVCIFPIVTCLSILFRLMETCSLYTFPFWSFLCISMYRNNFLFCSFKKHQKFNFLLYIFITKKNNIIPISQIHPSSFATSILVLLTPAVLRYSRANI